LKLRPFIYLNMTLKNIYILLKFHYLVLDAKLLLINMNNIEFLFIFRKSIDTKN